LDPPILALLLTRNSNNDSLNYIIIIIIIMFTGQMHLVAAWPQNSFDDTLLESLLEELQQNW
jgi:hypothetical protein